MLLFINRIAKQPTSKTVLNYWRNYSKLQNVTPVCVRASDHGSSVALVDYSDTYTYKELLQSSRSLAAVINKLCAKSSSKTQQNRIAYLCSNDVSYVIAQWASWLSGNIAVPLHKSHPTPQLEYYIKDSESAVIISTKELISKVEPIASKFNLPLFELGNSKSALKSLHAGEETVLSKDFYNSADALIIYTSGTTGPPKGVLLTHSNLQAQVETIIKALKLSDKDSVLHMLPLHHTHGIIHALLSPLHVGGRLVMLPKFDAKEVWKQLLSDKNQPERVNVMLAVPTMYVKLIEDYNESHKNIIDPKIKAICKEQMRLMVSGSSALPEPIFNKWELITGHRILERYGMTEIGLSLTNPVHGDRKPGFVGNPIGCVQVCIAVDNDKSPNGYDVIARGSENGTTVTKGKEGEAGELLVKGPNVFKEYYNKSDATKKTFTKDGWFKTGDTVSFQDGSYKIEGRTSVDIIKSGGYKISALDVERHLLSHPAVLEAVVVGVPDPVWGQRVAAVIVMREKTTELTLPSLREWCKERMAPYAVPAVLKILDSLPKNAVGKVNKKELVKNIFPEYKS